MTGSCVGLRATVSGSKWMNLQLWFLLKSSEKIMRVWVWLCAGVSAYSSRYAIAGVNFKDWSLKRSRLWRGSWWQLMNVRLMSSCRAREEKTPSGFPAKWSCDRFQEASIFDDNALLSAAELVMWLGSGERCLYRLFTDFQNSKISIKNMDIGDSNGDQWLVVRNNSDQWLDVGIMVDSKL